MAINFLKIVKGIILKNDVDQTKQLKVQINAGATTGTSTTLEAAQTSNVTVTLPNATTTLDGIDNAATLTNKSISATTNTITNISNTEIKAAAAIDATKIAAGTVSSTVFGYLAGATSAIQTQLNTKATLTGSETLQNKTIDVTNVVTLKDSFLTIQDDGDLTKQLKLQLSGITSGVTRVLTVPDASTTIVGTDAPQTLTNKTLTANTAVNLVSGAGTLTLNTAGSVTIPSSSDTLVGRITTDTGANRLKNKDLEAGTTQIVDGTDTSKIVKFQASGATTATSSTIAAAQTASRVITLPDATTTLVGTDATQILTNKTLSGNTATNLISGAGTLTLNTSGTATVPNATDTLVGKATTDILTNKDIDGGTASNSKRITLPKDTLTNLQALTRKQGTLVFDTTSTKPYYDDGSNLKVIGSGSSGTVNFITDGDAEGAQIFSVYNDASTTRPVDGTGGTNANLAAAISATTPLAGLNSFTLTKSGTVSTQGSGFSIGFTIDSAYKAKVLQISYDYIVNSGTFAAGSTTSDSDIIAYIYDVTNSQLIEPSGIKLFSNSSTISDKYIANFQTSATGTSYRLIFHCSSTSAVNYSLKIDNIAVTPSSYVYGTPITDWVSYTPTGIWSTNATYAGKWRRVGDSMQISGTVSLTGAPTGVFQFNIPSGYTIDTNKINGLGAAASPFGTVSILRAGFQVYPGVAYYNSTTSIQATFGAANGAGVNTNNGVVNATNPATFASGDVVGLEIQVPIAGWSSSVQVSDSYDNRVVAARVTTSSQALGNGTVDTAILTSKDYDTTNSYSVSTGLFACPASGYYRVSFTATTLARVTATWDITNYIYVNSTSKAQSNFYSTFGTGTHLMPPQTNTTVYCNAGDTISGRVRAGYASASLDGSSVSNVLTIEKIQASATISATEVVAAIYKSSAANLITSSVLFYLDFPTKEDDTHSAVIGAGLGNTSTSGSGWRLIAPAAGFYYINAGYTFVMGSSPAGGNVIQLLITVNGGNRVTVLKYDNVATNSYTLTANRIIKLNVGDRVEIGAFQNSGQTLTQATSDLNYWASIARVK